MHVLCRLRKSGHDGHDLLDDDSALRSDGVWRWIRVCGQRGTAHAMQLFPWICE
jgi:hypothetical protein